MDGIDGRDVSFEKLDRGYDSQWELLEDLLALCDCRLYLLYKYHQWLGPENDMKNMLGLVVTREEFEYNLVKAAQRGIVSRVAPAEKQELYDSEAAVRLRLGRTDKGSIPLLRLFEGFGLDAFQQGCVLLAYAAELDAKYEKLFAFLQDDITKKRPTLSLAVQLYLPEDGTVEQYMARFSREDVFTALFDRALLAEGTLALCGPVSEYLGAGLVPDRPGLRLYDPKRNAPEGPMAVRTELARELEAVFGGDGRRAVLISGPAGIGKRFQLEHLFSRKGEPCVFADMDVLEEDEASVRSACLLARLAGAYLCFCHLGGKDADGNDAPPAPAFLSALADASLPRDKLFLLSEKPLHAELGMVETHVEMPELAVTERLALFEAFLAGAALGADLSLEELASKFRFTPRQIRLACAHAVGNLRVKGLGRLDAASLHACCYRQATHRLDALATRIKPAFDWEDVVLPPGQKKLMRHACDHIRYQHRVFYGWGFDKKITYGRGLSILFAGAPGTGKTMCAQVIAKQLNMEIYKINISQIVSKYIGETEKNLQAVFSEAKNSNCILFFDECDAIFGKRSEVKDAHDRNANVETAYLLQQIEEFDGVCILATNLLQNIDEAFMRRITYVVRFPFPDKEMRKEIYRRTIPGTAPVAADVDWDFIAERFELSGGYIKNIVLSAAFSAAGENTDISMRHLIGAAVNELKKNGIVVVREQLREYADLIDD